jgi:hypothetical protein
MARRGIPRSWVEEALAVPEQVVEGYGGRRVAHKRIAVEGKQYLLRVVHEEVSDARVVVTAYLTSDIARYWEEVS